MRDEAIDGCQIQMPKGAHDGVGSTGFVVTIYIILGHNYTEC